MKLYHLSPTNLTGQKLTPRVPSNYMTKHGYEEGKTPRVCFSESIYGCLVALGYNIPKGTKFYVHEPETYNGLKIKSNSQVVKLIPDAHITKEVWVMEEVKLRATKIIEVTGYDTSNPNGFDYSYGKNGEFTATVYGWKFKEIKLNALNF